MQSPVASRRTRRAAHAPRFVAQHLQADTRSSMTGASAHDDDVIGSMKRPRYRWRTRLRRHLPVALVRLGVTASREVVGIGCVISNPMDVMTMNAQGLYDPPSVLSRESATLPTQQVCAPGHAST